MNDAELGAAVRELLADAGVDNDEVVSISVIFRGVKNGENVQFENIKGSHMWVKLNGE